jgi:hypothetical protein
VLQYIAYPRTPELQGPLTVDLEDPSSAHHQAHSLVKGHQTNRTPISIFLSDFKQMALACVNQAIAYTIHANAAQRYSGAWGAAAPPEHHTWLLRNGLALNSAGA